MKISGGLAAMVVIAAVACSSAPTEEEGPSALPTVDDGVVTTQSSKAPYNGIYYQGGPVLLNQVNVYAIYYGNFTAARDYTTNVNTFSGAVPILEDLVKNLGGSPYWGINTTYFDTAGSHISNNLHFGGSTTDAYSQDPVGATTHTTLTMDSLAAIVQKAIIDGKLPADANAVYVVYGSKGVQQMHTGPTDAFCNGYCGVHYRKSISVPGGGTIDAKFAFVGDPNTCPSTCRGTPNAVYTNDNATSPNGSLTADIMATVAAHELAEAVSDPDPDYLTGWNAPRGESADHCAGTYGLPYPAGGGVANVRLGARDFLLQQNWVNTSGGYCAMHVSTLQSPGTLTRTANVAIPDRGSVTDSFTLGGTAVVQDLDLVVDIKHPSVSDLTITLAKDGISVIVLSTPGVTATQPDGCAHNNVKCTFDDAGKSDANDNCSLIGAAIGGVVAPHQSLAHFNGRTLAGTWTLTVADGRSGNVGTLNSWSLVAR